MLCYTLPCLADKRALNMLCSSVTPCSLAFSGAQGETEGILLSVGTKRQVVEREDYCAGISNDRHVFTLTLCLMAFSAVFSLFVLQVSFRQGEIPFSTWGGMYSFFFFLNHNSNIVIKNWFHFPLEKECILFFNHKSNIVIKNCSPPAPLREHNMSQQISQIE